MKTVGVNVMPILGGDEMAERISVAVHCDFGVTCCARGEEHEHGVIAEGSFFTGRSFENIAELAVFFIEAVPAVTGAVSNNLCFKNVALCGCKLNLMSYVAVSGAYDCADAACIEAIFKIVLNKLVCCRNNDCTNLMKSKD